LEINLSKESKGNRPERQLAALAKQALRTSVYTYIEYFETQFTYGILHITNKLMSCEAVRDLLLRRVYLHEKHETGLNFEMICAGKHCNIKQILLCLNR
jgi:hypothetical protein